MQDDRVFGSMEILISEDDSDTAVMFKKILERRHHKVTVTKSGEECLEIYQEKLKNTSDDMSTKVQIQPFDVMILDYKMGDIDGMKVAKEIFALNPRQRIIFASAYVKEALLDSVNELTQPVELLQKPFVDDALIYTVEKREVYSELQRLVYFQISNLLEVYKKLVEKCDLEKELESVQLRHEEIRLLLETLGKFEK